MELVDLENLRDQIQDRIKDIDIITDKLTTELIEAPCDYRNGMRDAKIEEVEFLSRHLESILKEIEKVLKDMEEDKLDGIG